MVQFVSLQKRKRRNAALAIESNEMRIRRYQKLVLAKIRHVLRYERLWLKEVRY